MAFKIWMKWKLKSRAEKRAALESLKNTLRDYHQTNDLLNMATDKNIKIKFDAGLIGSCIGGQYNAREKRITVNPVLGDAGTLAHELRHMWQFYTLGFSNNEWDFSRQPNIKKTIMFNRLIEADAFAFAAGCDHVFKAQKDVRKTYGEYTTKTKLNQCFKQGDVTVKMRDEFKLMASCLNVYDVKKISHYHTYVGDKNKGVKREITLKDMRKILKRGVKENATEYFPTLPDKKLALMLWSPVKKNVRRDMRLMDRFEKAVRNKKISIPARWAYWWKLDYYLNWNRKKQPRLIKN